MQCLLNKNIVKILPFIYYLLLSKLCFIYYFVVWLLHIEMGRKCTVNNCTTKNYIANRLLCKLASMQSPMVFLNIDIGVFGLKSRWPFDANFENSLFCTLCNSNSRKSSSNPVKTVGDRFCYGQQPKSCILKNTLFNGFVLHQFHFFCIFVDPIFPSFIFPFSFVLLFLPPCHTPFIDSINHSAKGGGGGVTSPPPLYFIPLPRRPVSPPFGHSWDTHQTVLKREKDFLAISTQNKTLIIKNDIILSQ